MNKKTYIYGLVDPTLNEIKYIGKTVDLRRRFNRHLNESKLKNTYKNNWIQKILKENLKPELFIIDEVKNDEWQYWERFYIEYFKYLGFKLTNSTLGGDGTDSGINNPNYGKKRSEITRNKISKAKKGKSIPWLNNEKPRSEEHKLNLSKSCKGRISPNKGLILTEERKKEFSKAHNYEKIEIVQLCKNGEFIKVWFGINETEKKLKIRHISDCCNGKVKTAGGFVWKYYKDYEQ